MAPMGQGPAPLPDQQKEFMKLMDMEEQVQGQKQAAALQGTSALASLLSSAEGMMQQYPQTSPSGQAVQPPPTPPMTYGSQVNLGLASGGTVNAFGGGFMKIMADMVRMIKDKQSRGEDINIPFSGGRGMNQLLSRDVYSNPSSPATSTQSPGGAESMNQLLARPAYSKQAATGGFLGYDQGGIINRADGGPTRQQFNDFMKNISNTPMGLIMRVSGLDKQFESQLPQENAGMGAESMNQLLSRDVYSNNTGSVAPASTQSLGGAASMNQLLARPAYSRQAAEGGIVEYNQGGMPSQGQPYFEGQVEGPGDGQSDEIAFRVDGGQVDGAMLSRDEYVLAADVVSAIGNGSSDAGAEKLDQFMKNVRQDAYGTTKQMQPFNNQGLTNLVA
jgi:hypothetical protein